MGGRGISILVGYVLFATVAHAQTMILPTGTILRVKLETPVSIKTISFNDRVEATLVQPHLPSRKNSNADRYAYFWPYNQRN
jgi:hypothetical protein